MKKLILLVFLIACFSTISCAELSRLWYSDGDGPYPDKPEDRLTWEEYKETIRNYRKTLERYDN